MSDKPRWELRAYRGAECRDGWFVRGSRRFAYSRAAAALAADKFDDLGDGWTRVEVRNAEGHDGFVRVSVDCSARAKPRDR